PHVRFDEEGQKFSALYSSAVRVLSKVYCPFCYITIKILENSIEQLLPVLYNDINKTVLLYNS
ncbi:hypothetical protein, partial [Paenibacillus thiaminolyticus]|uniref:hypothetical protein n=1 Tax=Paenibacillus thiaminolyticus TaxID=49283 RepID=UPI001C720D98